jgi:hypothetical protein
VTFLAKDIRDHLAGSTYIVDAFSNRIFSETIPQNISPAYPAIVINELSNSPEYYLGGESGKHSTTLQIDLWTDGTGGIAKTNELSELIRNRMSGYRGQFGSGAYGTSRLISNNSAALPPTDSSDDHRRRVSMDFEFIHTADAPTFT